MPLAKKIRFANTGWHITSTIHSCFCSLPYFSRPQSQKKFFARDKKLKIVTISGKTPLPPSPDAPPARPPDTSKLDSAFDDMLLDCTVDADSYFIDGWGVANTEEGNLLEEPPLWSRS